MNFDGLDRADHQRLLDAMTGPHGTPPSRTDVADLLVVFGSDDPALAFEAARLVSRGVVRHVVFSGGVGKDSGELASLGIAEADFLASVAIGAGMPAKRVLIERHARNGAENAAFALQLAAEAGLLTKGSAIASLAPAQRSRRLYEELRYQASVHFASVRIVAGLSTGPSELDSDASLATELLRELRGLCTMHDSRPPRIFVQSDFQPGGVHFDLVKKAGFSE